MPFEYGGTPIGPPASYYPDGYPRNPMWEWEGDMRNGRLPWQQPGYMPTPPPWEGQLPPALPSPQYPDFPVKYPEAKPGGQGGSPFPFPGMVPNPNPEPGRLPWMPEPGGPRIPRQPYQPMPIDPGGGQPTAPRPPAAGGGWPGGPGGGWAGQNPRRFAAPGQVRQGGQPIGGGISYDGGGPGGQFRYQGPTQGADPARVAALRSLLAQRMRQFAGRMGMQPGAQPVPADTNGIRYAQDRPNAGPGAGAWQGGRY